MRLPDLNSADFYDHQYREEAHVWFVGYSYLCSQTGDGTSLEILMRVSRNDIVLIGKELTRIFHLLLRWRLSIDTIYERELRIRDEHIDV